MNIKKSLSIIPLIIILHISHLFALEVIIQGSINETYDDNINTSSTDSESDLVTNILLGITAQSEIRAFDFEFSGNTYQQIFANNPENSTNFQDLTLSLEKIFSDNISLQFGNTLQHYPESRSLDVLFRRGEADSGYLSNDFQINLSLNITEKLFLTGNYAYGIMNNDSDEISDSVSHNPGGAIGYSFNTANTFRLGYLYHLMQYEYGERISADSGYVEYEKHFTTQLRSLIMAGYDYIDSDTGQSLSKRWMASLIDDVDENNQFNITYEYGNTISNIVNDILKNWTIRGTLIRQISFRTIIDMSFFYGEGTYQISGVSDILFGASANFAYLVTDFVNFNIGYRFTWSRSDASGSDVLEYRRNQFSGGFLAAY